MPMERFTYTEVRESHNFCLCLCLPLKSSPFIGYTSRIIATGKEVNGYQHFGDIWCLDLDIPEYNDQFDEKAFEDCQSFKAGAFRRCFQCKKSGLKYLRCQGACGGKGIYCSEECQRKERRFHKRTYGCRKL